MRAKGACPAVESASRFVQARLSEQSWHSGEIMPSIRSFAGMAGVSVHTMIRAMARLKEEGLVSGSSRHRFRAGSGDLEEEAAPKRALRWIEKKQQFEHDIVTGRFRSTGGIPSLKELKLQYGVCFKTMQKILQSLVAGGILKPAGKKYEISGARPRHLRERIVMIVHKGYLADWTALDHKNNRAVNLFEKECIRMGLHLEIVEVDYYNTLDGCTAYKPDRDDAVRGFILEGWMSATRNLFQAYVDMLGRLCSTGKPVAILDHLGNFILPARFTANPLVQVFGIQRERAGEHMARYLLNLGHTEAVYLSPFHYAPWSQDRYKGIADQFSRAGYANSVHLAVDSVYLFLPAMLTVSGLSDKDVRNLLTPRLTPSQKESLEKEWMDFKKSNHPPYPGFPRLTASEVRYLAKIVALNPKVSNDRLVVMTQAGTLDAFALNIFERSLLPLFATAIKQKKATAWICANDNIALGAISFLRERKVGVPAGISIVGFDNEPVTALENRLTTFDFNALEFIHLMAGFILRPPKARGPVKNQAVEIEGFVVERGTAGVCSVRGNGCVDKTVGRLANERLARP